MPNYDRVCEGCGAVVIDVMEPVHAPNPPCEDCGAPMLRAWLTKPPSAIGDETDFVSHNGERHPRRFRSKQEHKRWLKEKGYTIKDEHIGQQGTDKSPHSTPWVAGGKEWLANAEAAAKAHHNGGYRGNPPAEPSSFPNIRWSTGTVSETDLARYRGQS